MSTTPAAIPPTLAEMITALNAMDGEIARAKGEHDRLSEAEQAIVDRLERLAHAGNDRERDVMIEELRPLLPGATMPDALNSTDDLAALAVAASNELQRLGSEMGRTEVTIQRTADRRDDAAKKFANVASDAIRTNPAIVEPLRAAMGLAPAPGEVA